MSKETTVNRATPAKPATTPHAGSGSEETRRAEQAAQRAGLHQGLVAERAYELYEQRGRQEGRALEDWLNAESQLLGRAIQGQA
jgi:hypothetical protein